MRVVCIDSECLAEDGLTPLVKGNIYTVIDTRNVNEFRTKSGRLAVNGIYYNMVETGDWYHSSLFIPINENQQDETELLKERESNLQTI